MFTFQEKRRKLYRQIRACYRGHANVRLRHRFDKRPSLCDSILEFFGIFSEICWLPLACASWSRRKCCVILPTFCILITIIILQGDPRSRLQLDLQQNFMAAQGLIGSLTRWGGDGTSTQEGPTLLPVLQPDCQALYAGNQVELHITREMLYTESRVSITDQQMAQAGQNCTLYRNYVRPLPQSEPPVGIGYIVLVNKHAEQVLRLLQATQSADNVYCIIFSGSMTHIFQAAIASMQTCFDNVHLLHKPQVIHSTYSRLKVEMQCMRELQERNSNLHYFMNLDGSSYPLKSNSDIRKSLRSLEGHDIIPIMKLPKTSPLRTSMISNSTNSNDLRTKLDRTQPYYVYQHKPIPLYSGRRFFIASVNFVNFIVHEPIYSMAREFIEWLQREKIPDTLFWATLSALQRINVRNAIDSTDYLLLPAYMNLSQTKTRQQQCAGMKDQDNLCIFGVGDLPWLARQSSLFAYKFDVDFDHLVLDCLESQRKEVVTRPRKEQLPGLMPPVR